MAGKKGKSRAPRGEIKKRGVRIPLTLKILVPFVTFILGLYQAEIRRAIDKTYNLATHLFMKAPSVVITRSLFNNTFELVKSSQGRDSIVLTGANVTHQIWASVSNLTDEELLLEAASVYDSEGKILLFERTFGEAGFRLPPSKVTLLKVESPSLLGKEWILRAIERGRLTLVLKTMFGKFSYPVDCICFAMAKIMPNGTYFYTIGKDSSCINFELYDPEGVTARTKLPLQR
jgi:hypothetical protein